MYCFIYFIAQVKFSTRYNPLYFSIRTFTILNITMEKEKDIITSKLQSKYPVCNSRKLFDHLKLSRSISCCFFTFISRTFEEFPDQIQYFEDLELIFIKGLAVAVLLINEIPCKKKRSKVTPFNVIHKPMDWRVYDYNKNKLGSLAMYTNSLYSKYRELLFVIWVSRHQAKLGEATQSRSFVNGN